MKTIQLTQGKETIVCDCHYDELSKHSWHTGVDGYAYKTGIAMHRFIVKDIPEGYEVDHINHDRLDNRCENLKAVPYYFNRQRGKNTGLKKSGKNTWGAYITRAKQHYWLGVFNSREEARAEYNRASNEYHETGKITIKKEKYGR